MPRNVFPYKPPSKGAMRMRVHRYLKRLENERQQIERLRLEGGATTSHSVPLPTQPAEPVVIEGVIDYGDESVQRTVETQPGSSEERVDDMQFLRRWVSENNVSPTALGQLLCHLRRTNPSLPVDPRALMKTPRITDLRKMSPGMYSHYGLRRALERTAPNVMLQGAEYVGL